MLHRSLRPDPHLSDVELTGAAGARSTLAQRTRWIGHLHRCERCREILRQHVAERERLGVLVPPRRVSRIEALTRASLHRAAPRRPIRVPPSRHAASRWMPLAAAVVIAGATAVLWFAAARAPWAAIASSHAGSLPSDPDVVTLRNGDAGAAAWLREGLRRYGRGEHADAVAWLERVPPDDPTRAVARLYGASALVRLGRFELALEHLDETQNRLPEPWDAERRWLTALAHLGAGRAATADSVLRVLERDAPEWRGRVLALRDVWPAP